jgi:hypothetical protein
VGIYRLSGCRREFHKQREQLFIVVARPVATLNGRVFLRDLPAGPDCVTDIDKPLALVLPTFMELAN